MACQGCGHSPVGLLIDLGRQPLSNRFLADRNAAEDRFPLSVGQCSACGLVQLVDLPPSTELLPRFAWMTYREPEDHIPDLAKRLVAELGLGPTSRICAFSSKDHSTLDALVAHGVSNGWRLSTEAVLAAGRPAAAVETLTDIITPEIATDLKSSGGGADLVVIRQILEHTANLPRLLKSLHALLAPGGTVMVEIPDCGVWLRQPDYTGIWEEHRLYLTPETAAAAFRNGGFTVRAMHRFPYPFEDSLVFLLSPSARSRAAPSALAEELEVGRRFATGFRETSRRAAEAIADLRRAYGKVALFGAGHFACAFLNYLELGAGIEAVIDDNQHKVGLFMPGSRLPIVPSSVLAAGDINVCLTCFAPEYEDRVMAKNAAFTARGGVFRSIFRGSSRSLLTEATR
jgi:SAM-dependent methyltransferase